MRKLSLFGLLFALVACLMISCSESDPVVAPEKDPVENPDDPNKDPNEDPDDPNEDPDDPNDDPNDDPDTPGDDPEGPVNATYTYLDATAIYMGTDKVAGHSVFQVQMAPKSLISADLPLHYCFLQLIANPVTDLENLALEAGEYNVLEGDTPMPMTFYPSVRMAEGYGGSVIYELDQDGYEHYLEIVGGKVTVTNEATSCTISGELLLSDNGTINFSFSGVMLMRDQSGESGEPAGEVAIPVSTLTEDVVYTPDPKECYYSRWAQRFNDYPRFDYFMIQLCKDDTYAEALVIGLLVDRTVYTEDVLPSGKYFVMNRSQQEWETMTLAAMESFRVTTPQDPYIDIGSMYQTDFSTFHSLVGGEVTIHSFDPATGQVDMSWALTTNGTPVTVSGSYKGKLTKI